MRKRNGIAFAVGSVALALAPVSSSFADSYFPTDRSVKPATSALVPEVSKVQSPTVIDESPEIEQAPPQPPQTPLQPPPPPQRRRKGRPAPAPAPAFDPGLVDFYTALRLLQLGRPDLAREKFRSAIAHGYAPATTRLYLGRLAIDSNDLPGARKELLIAIDSGAPTQQMVGRFYLSLVEMREGHDGKVVENLTRVVDLASGLGSSALAARYKAIALSMLRPYQSSLTTMTLGMLGFYNSNIAQAALGDLPPFEFPGLATAGTNLLAGISWFSPTARRAQLSLSYQGNISHNFNPDAADYQFFTHNVGAILAFDPLSKIVAGLKVTGNFTLLSGGQAGPGLKPSDLSSDMGPFLRAGFGSIWESEMSLVVRLRKNLVFDNISGHSVILTEALRLKPRARWIRPEVRLTMEDNLANDNQFQYFALGFGGGSSFQVTDSTLISLNADFVATQYPFQVLGRQDELVMSRLTLNQRLAQHWNLLVDFSYLRNNSNLPDLFSYNGLVASAGVLCTF